MCLAVPGKVVEVEGDLALVDYGGTRSRVNISLLERVDVGDYVIVHVGYAIQRLVEKNARESIDLWKEMLGGEL